MVRAPRAYIDIEIVGDTRGVDRMLRKMEDRLSPPGMGVWLKGSVVPWLRTRAKNRFASEGDDATGPWAPLQPFTQMQRAQQGYGPASPINNRTGAMERYITGDTGDVVTTPLGNQLTWPSPAPNSLLAEKVETAQIGKDSPLTQARPVLAVNARDLEGIMITLASYIQR